MGAKIKKIALLTGGSDCPGINAAIRAITKTAILNYGYEVIGFKGGFLGLYHNDFIKLDLNAVSGILRKGGSILYTSNKDNLFEYEDKETGEKMDVSDIAINNLHKNAIDTLVVLGGDDSLKFANTLYEKGIKVIGIPKTIDNDIPETDVTFGFNSALTVAVTALDRLHTTAESHHRVMILEVMGREAGWIALEAGIAGSADVILIPEIPFDLNKVAEKIRKRKESGKLFTIIIAAEGAVPVNRGYDRKTIGSVGHKVADALETLVKGQEIRCTVLGHTQRGGDASTYDRLLATRLGVNTVKLIEKGIFGTMVSIKGNKIIPVPFSSVIDNSRLVNPQGELIEVARAVGIEFGD